jgi:hypothetical protein
MVVVVSLICMTPIAQVSNAVDSINTGTIDCNSKKGTADTSAGAFKYGGAKCEGQNGGTVAAGGIKPVTGNTNITSKSTIDCNSKKGTADTSAGAFKYGGAKCEGQNGGTVAAGGIKSGSGSIGLHGSQGPNGNSHFGGIIKR